MNMDWVTGAVIVACIVGVCVLVEMFLKKPKLDPLSRDAEVISLKGKIEAYSLQIQFMKERGDRHVAAREAAEDRLKQMYDIFTDIIKKTGESKLLSKLLEEQLKESK